MAKYREFQKVKRLGTSDVSNIQLGEVYVFPKLDGTNASIFWDDDKNAHGAGSRTRSLSTHSDNAGFFNTIFTDEIARQLTMDFPTWNIYGEWLVPHSIKGYRDECWRKFYIFDVWDETVGEEGDYLHFKDYEIILKDYMPEGSSELMRIMYPQAVITNGDDVMFQQEANNTKYCLKDGFVGEGVVLKNYHHINDYGRNSWAKVVTNQFKEANDAAFGPKEITNHLLEQALAEKYVTRARVEKIHNKIVTEKGDWQSKYIGELLGRVWNDLILEETWEVIRAHKNPTINFGLYNRFVIMKVKEVAKELF